MSNSLTRTYTFANGGIAYGDQVDTEIQAIVNTINNADAGTTSWTVVKTVTLTVTGTATISGQLIGKGTATSDSAATGYIGEYISASNAINSNYAATTVWDDLVSISLTAGDWDVSAISLGVINGATWSENILGISSTSGNSETGLVAGDNRIRTTWANSSTTPTIVALTIPSFRVSLAGTTTYYLKQQATFSAGTPQRTGRISARRVR